MSVEYGNGIRHFPAAVRLHEGAGGFSFLAQCSQGLFKQFYVF